MGMAGSVVLTSQWYLVESAMEINCMPLLSSIKVIILSYLENIVGEEFVVKDIKDIRNAFEADIHKLMGKTVMIWDE